MHFPIPCGNDGHLRGISKCYESNSLGCPAKSSYCRMADWIYLLESSNYINQDQYLYLVLQTQSSIYQYRVKRVVGLGWQLCRASDRFRRLERVPPFSLWVESDNQKSNGNRLIDTRTYGAVSKKCEWDRRTDIVASTRCGGFDLLHRMYPSLGGNEQ